MWSLLVRAVTDLVVLSIAFSGLVLVVLTLQGWVKLVYAHHRRKEREARAKRVAAELREAAEANVALENLVTATSPQLKDLVRLETMWRLPAAENEVPPTR